MSNISTTATRTPYAVTNSTTGVSSSTPINTASSTTPVATASTTPNVSTTPPQGANVANTQNTGTVSASTTSAYGSSASNSLSNPVGSTTPSISEVKSDLLGTSNNESKECIQYAYLSHLGTEASYIIEEALIYLGYDKSKDGEFIEELKKFKNDYNLYEYSVYDPLVVDKLSEVYNNTDEGIVIYVEEEKMKNAGFQNVTKESLYELNVMLSKYGITSQNEINHFLAQCYVESWHGKATIEINWNNQMPDEEYFNLQYDFLDRLGNEKIGDGYKYRGAGYIQLTGRYNYDMFAKHIGDEKILELGAEYVSENYAWEASAWFWSKYVHHLFGNEGEPTVEEVTQIINNNLRELEQREAAYLKISEK